MNTNKRAQRKKSAFRAITGRLAELSQRELKELRAIIDALLEPEYKPDPIILKKYSSKKRSSAGQGHIEAKKIRGYGPYLYLRYYSDGRLKSIYIGKPRKS